MHMLVACLSLVRALLGSLSLSLSLSLSVSLSGQSRRGLRDTLRENQLPILVVSLY